MTTIAHYVNLLACVAVLGTHLKILAKQRGSKANAAD